MFREWGPLLGITSDENDFAIEEAFKAVQAFEDEMERKGREILAEVTRENRVALVMLGRPYHNDPGLNHAVLEEFQALGYPILSMRSLPRDKETMDKLFAEDLKKGRITTPLEINDVWPENYSSNSAQKVWAAKFAAHHPNVVVLDLSSFKCGHDAPTYGIIDSIIGTAQTPYSALHDIDANKPGGSIKIRVKTYAHSLTLHKERLDDVSRDRQELLHQIDRKRLALLSMKSKQLADRSQKDEAVERQIREITERVAAYEVARLKPSAEEKASAARDEMKKAGIVQLGIMRGDGRVQPINNSGAAASSPS